MNINNYEFSNLTKEDLGVDLEKVINTHLFKLVRRCIENENIIFYDKATNRYGTCDEETYENYIKNRSLNLIIEDNGIGIPESDINRVFDKGFTGENGRVYGKSTGIGLYLCRKLCDKLQLQIELESKYGV